MLRLYPHGDIPFQTKQKMIAKLSDGIFDESPVKENLKMSTSKLYTPSLRQRLTESDGSGTDSDKEEEQPHSGKMVQTKAPTDEEMVELIDELMRTPNRLSARDKEREEEQMEKFKNALSKLDKGHMVAIFKHILKPFSNISSVLFSILFFNSSLSHIRNRETVSYLIFPFQVF